MEMKYLRVPTTDTTSSDSRSVDDSPRHASSGVKRVVRWLNSYIQISSPAYQHGRTERKLSLGIFLFFFVCFVFSMVFLFSGGDMCSSHTAGLERLRLERDNLKQELLELKAQLEASTEPPSIAEDQIEHVIP